MNHIAHAPYRLVFVGMALIAAGLLVRSAYAEVVGPPPINVANPNQGAVLGDSDIPYRFETRLSVGANGEAVVKLQERLTEEEVYSGPITGYFGPMTETAVKALQSKYQIESLGIVGPKTIALLNRQFIDEITATTPPIPSATIPEPGGSGRPGIIEHDYYFTKALRKGDSGEEVKKLQERLASEGYFTEAPTGYFGSVTEEAVKALQVRNDIEPLGIVGPKTILRLNGVTNPNTTTMPMAVPAAPSAEAATGAVAPPPPPPAAAAPAL